MVQNLDLQQAKKAVSALFKYNNSKSDNDMLDSAEENSIYIQITTHKVMNKASLKKSKITLKNSPFAESLEVCLITKDAESVMEPKTASISPITKVVSVKTLGSVYKNYEARRKLCDSYDLFLVDDRVVHLMPNLLGKYFFKKNKSPVAIKTSSLKNSIESTLKSTFVKLNNGINTLVVIGNFGMSEEDVLANYEAAVPALVKIVAHQWDQVQLIGIKSAKSPILPIYAALPTEKDLGNDEEEEEKEEKNKETKKATPAKKAAAAPAKKEIPAKKEAPAKKAAPAKKEAPAKKAAPVKKAAAPAKKTATKKETAVAPAKKTETKKVTKKVVKSRK